MEVKVNLIIKYLFALCFHFTGCHALAENVAHPRLP